MSVFGTLKAAAPEIETHPSVCAVCGDMLTHSEAIYRPLGMGMLVYGLCAKHKTWHAIYWAGGDGPSKIEFMAPDAMGATP